MATTARAWLRAHAGRLITAIALVGVAAVGAAAVVQTGFPQQPPLPQNRSLWVPNGQQSLVGRINPSAAQLDSALEVNGDVQLLQDGGIPMVVDTAAHELQFIDPATVTIGTRVALADTAVVQAGGGVVAVADPSDGSLRVGTTGSGAGLDQDSAPVAQVGPGVVVAVSSAGSVFALAPGADRLTVIRAGAVESVAIDGGALADRSVQLTAVGDVPVVLDAAGGVLWSPGYRLTVPQTTDGVLQQSGPSSDGVLVATTGALTRVTLQDGTVESLVGSFAADTGTPHAPIWAGGCGYGLWTGNVDQAVRACRGTPAELEALDGDLSEAYLTDRGDDVLVVSPADGRSWLAGDGFRLIDNWDDVVPPDIADPDKTDRQDELDSDLTPPPPPNCATVPVGEPRAADDALGARAGRTTVLRVLENDPAVDCTSVVIDRVGDLPAGVGTVQIVGGGTAIQLTLPDTAAGELPEITYEVSNGLGATAEATVQVTVAPAGDTRDPQRLRRSAVQVEAGATTGYNVIDDYQSPTGDDLFLVSATTDDGDEVSYRPDGTITYRSIGTGAGADRAVQFVVSDGIRQVSGTLDVSIAEPGTTTPISYPAHVQAITGTPATVDVTRTMTSGSANALTVTQVTGVPGADGAASHATAVVDDSGHRIVVSSTTAGTYYFTFQASAGDRSTTGVLRADVVSVYDRAAVVPMLDIAYVPNGSPAILDPLANDTDPAGSGLAVQSVGTSAGVTAAVTDLHLVQIATQRPLTSAVTLPYSVFDGTDVATGEIRVISVTAPERIPPPLVEPIQVTVRAGDAVTIPVDSYASSQDGSPLTVDVDTAQTPDLPGVAFASGADIRYLAPTTPPTEPVVFGYTAIAGSSTEDVPVRASSTVTVTVVPLDDGRNTPPGTPQTVIARVFAGGTVSVDLPLAGIDADGDWVTATSLVPPTAPLGKATLNGSGSLGYTALDTPGIDQLQYVVSDPLGGTATGSVTVLVVPTVGQAGPPVAPDLTASVRPGATVRVDPLQSVRDPGGSPVRLDAPAFDAPVDLPVTVDDGALLITAPATETVLSLQYRVVNAKGLSATGAIRLTVSATAPQLPPLAGDVFVPPTDLGTGAASVDVDVSSRIVNRTGPRSALSLSVASVSAAAAQPVGPSTVRVTLADRRQVIAYQVTDTIGGSATGFLVVPPKSQLVGPQLIAGKEPIAVDAGTGVRIALADYVVVADGVPQLASGQALRATQGTATALSATEVQLDVPTDAGGPAVLYVPIDAGAEQAPAVLPLAVQIKPRNVPPPHLDGTVLPVEAGTNSSLDLAPLTRTFDAIQASSLTYRMVPPADASAQGFTLNLTDTVLSVAVRLDVPRGTELNIQVYATDGDGNEGGATVTVRATGSTKPLPIVVSQQVTGRAGQQVTGDLLQGSSDPIGLGLTVTNLVVADGAAGVSSGPTLTGSTLTFGTAPGFVGDITVTYDVLDATLDPMRTVGGSFNATLQDRPGQPGAPTVVAGSRTTSSVQLSWTPADAHGSALSGYTVRSGTGTWQCAPDSGTCLIDGLSTGVPYEFTVVAHNALGDSDVSPVSEQVIPDAVPSGYGAPSASYLARGQIAVNWSVPSGSFSPVSSMDLQILAGGSVVDVRSGVFPPMQLDGLDSSSSYTFQVRANNREGSGAWSAPSDAVLPSGVPSAPQNFTATYQFDGATQQVQLNWQSPADNGGEGITGYVLTDGGGAVLGRPDAGATSATVGVSGAGTQSYNLAAMNPRGTGAAASAQAQLFTRPGKVGGLTLTRQDGALGATWSAVDAPGSGIGSYQYQVNGGGWVSAGTNTSTTIGGLANGTAYSVAVRACNNAPDVFPESARCGDPSDPQSASPFGPIAAPAVSMDTPTTLSVTATWSFSGGNGRDVTSRTVTVKVGNDTQSGVDVGSGTWTGTVPSGATVTVTARMCVSGPDECTAETTKSVKAPYQYTVAAPDAMGGVCGETGTDGGEWLSTKAACEGAGGRWVADAAKVFVGCTTGGGDYPAEPPAATPTSDDWLRSVDGRYYRAVALEPPSQKPPSC